MFFVKLKVSESQAPKFIKSTLRLRRAAFICHDNDEEKKNKKF